MPNWVITGDSTPMDKIVGYRDTLQAMRAFVHAGGALQHNHVNVYGHALPSPNPPWITLRFSNHNFEVSEINGQPIDYNYPQQLPAFDCGTFPFAFPVNPAAVNLNQKTQLLFLFAEAARSRVIQDRMEGSFAGYGDVDLQSLEVLARHYAATCEVVQINWVHPNRPLTRGDYLAYAATLPHGYPVRIAIEQLLA